MTTAMKKKPRIAISVDKETEEALRLSAKRDQVPVATKACDLIRLALEIDEDQWLGNLMKERDTPDARYVSHDEAWKRIYANRKK